jgi:hypothetical protein
LKPRLGDWDSAHEGDYNRLLVRCQLSGGTLLGDERYIPLSKLFSGRLRWFK